MIKRMRVEKEIDEVDTLDSVVVERRIVVEREQEFRMVVPDGAERGELASEGRFLADGVCHLKVAGNSILNRNEINFAVCKDADVCLAEAPAQFEERYVFKEMPEVFALGSKNGSAKTGVRDIVFRRGLEILPSLDVVAIHTVKEKRLAERVDVGVKRGVGNGESFAFEHSDDLVDRKQIPDVVEEKLDDSPERCGVAVAVPHHDVFVEDRVEDAGKIVVLRPRSVLKLRSEGKSAEAQEVVEHGMGVSAGEQGGVFCDDEVHAIVSYIKERSEVAYDADMIEKMDNAARSDAEKEEFNSEYDPRLPEAVEIVVEAGQASVSMLQRRMRVGYARAGRLIDEMEQRGIVSEADGAKPRTVLITREEMDELFEEN